MGTNSKMSHSLRNYLCSIFSKSVNTILANPVAPNDNFAASTVRATPCSAGPPASSTTRES